MKTTIFSVNSESEVALHSWNTSICLQVTTFSNGHRTGPWAGSTSFIDAHGTSVSQSQHSVAAIGQYIYICFVNNGSMYCGAVSEFKKLNLGLIGPP
jgi:hypothetical protein